MRAVDEWTLGICGNVVSFCDVNTWSGTVTRLLLVANLRRPERSVAHASLTCGSCGAAIEADEVSSDFGC